ncbi:hypothetical protein OGAPHI_006050 [Ogataea philodendri]|uniref:Uncharacterized protein n=1 Tax=Ogataea philodendri TaxID=1378263 RepID=A0A9P8NZ28_9ASCO|nr:uncharacterized protein OGAPHI_006050 [Ogataea philodendri]KAH3661871.1 hypothetical protein OGAPHI_006050 [Ogataea philodendri]
MESPANTTSVIDLRNSMVSGAVSSSPIRYSFSISTRAKLLSGLIWSPEINKSLLPVFCTERGIWAPASGYTTSTTVKMPGSTSMPKTPTTTPVTSRILSRISPARIIRPDSSSSITWSFCGSEYACALIWSSLLKSAELLTSSAPYTLLLTSSRIFGLYFISMNTVPIV